MQFINASAMKPTQKLHMHSSSASPILLVTKPITSLLSERAASVSFGSSKCVDGTAPTNFYHPVLHTRSPGKVS